MKHRERISERTFVTFLRNKAKHATNGELIEFFEKYSQSVFISNHIFYEELALKIIAEEIVHRNLKSWEDLNRLLAKEKNRKDKE